MASLEDIIQFAHNVAPNDTSAEIAVILTLLDLSQNRQELASKFSRWMAEKIKREKEKK